MAARQLLQHRLPGAERAGDTVGTSLGDGEESVQDAQLCHQLLGGAQTLLVAGDGPLHRPGLHHGDLEHAALVLQFGDLVSDHVTPRGRDALDFVAPEERERNHDAMLEHTLGNPSQPVRGFHHVARCDSGCELPFEVPRQRVQVDAPLQEEAALRRHLGQWILQAVEDLG